MNTPGYLHSHLECVKLFHVVSVIQSSLGYAQQATRGGLYSRNAQSCSSLTSRTSGLPPMVIYKRGKTWWVTYSINGQQVWESAKTRDKAEARRILQAKVGQIAEGRYAGPLADRVTFEELAEGLFTDYQVNGKKTLRETRVRVEKHLRPFFGGKKAHEVTTADAQTFIAKRQAEGATNAEINRETAALKRAFNLAIQAEKIAKKPYIPKLEENSPRQGFFEPWQFDALLP